jgi:hypothetical protein
MIADSKNQQIIYVATDKGEIMIIEATQTRGENTAECKIRGRLSPSQNYQ